MNLWFTSDPHFSHRFLAIDIRGFESIEDHDETLIETLNSEIGKDDTVICVGDFSLKKPDVFAPILQRLNGNWHLISGNHDACWPGHRDAHKFVKPYIMAGFESVQPFMRRRIDGQNVLISHFPYEGDHTEEDRCEQYRLPNLGLPIIHGHTHESTTSTIAYGNDALQIHVGLDAWALQPVPMDTVVEMLRNYR